MPTSRKESPLSAMARNPNWTRDELILALDLYSRCSPLRVDENHPEVTALSKLLNDLPIHKVRPDPERFRNKHGVRMKLYNFLRLDPTYHGSGLAAGSKLDEEVWNEFAGDRERLSRVAEAIRQNAAANRLPTAGDYAGDEEFREGAILFRTHRDRERSTKAVEKRKEAATAAGSLTCEACGFEFERRYGDLGKGYIECHHRIPVSQLRPGQPTRLSDLDLVCSNCHRMLHRRSDLTIEKLRQLLLTRGG